MRLSYLTFSAGPSLASLFLIRMSGYGYTNISAMKVIMNLFIFYS